MFEFVFQVCADRERILLEAFGLDDVQHGQTDRARHGIPAERVEVLHAIIKGRRNLRCRDDGGHGVAVTDGFAERDDIGDDSLRLEPPKMRADASEPDLHLVGDAHRTGISGVCERRVEVMVW